MTPLLLLYGTVLGGFLAAAAHFLDRALRVMGRATRWIWMGALAGTALIPLILPFFPSGAAGDRTVGTVIPVETLFQLGLSSLPGNSGASTLLPALDQPLLYLWLVASGALLLLFTGGALILHRKAATWSRTLAGEEEILVSDGVGPAVMGIFRTRIVLPSWTLSLDAEELEMILLHEGEHRRARDPALLAGGIAMAILAPWNLPLWWSLMRLRLAVEGDCDGRVLARGICRDRYGNLLLEVASGSRGLSPLSPALTEGGGSFLERRLQMMKTSVRKGGHRGVALGVLAGAFFLFLACETPTPPLADEAGPLDLAQAQAVDGQTDVQFGENGPLLGIDADGRARFEANSFSLTGERISMNGPVTVRMAPNGNSSESDPLILIDDELAGRGQEILKNLNPDEIERIEVVKGSAAEALWGEAGANGVIKIYLKK